MNAFEVFLVFDFLLNCFSVTPYENFNFCFYNSVKYRSGTGKAIIALARKISTIMFVLLKNRIAFDTLAFEKGKTALDKAS